MQRNSLKLVLVAVLGLLLVAMTGYYTFQLAKERNQARREAAKSKQLVGLLTDMFKSVDPNVSQQDTLPVRFFLDSAGVNLGERLRDEPELLAEMSVLLSSVYDALGAYPKADSLARRAVALYRNETLHSPLGEAEAVKNLADVRYSLGYYGEADSIYLTAAGLFKKAEAAPELLGLVYHSLGNTSIELGEFVRADSFYALSYQAFDQRYDPPQVDLAEALHGRGDAHRKQRRFETAEEYYIQALEMKQQLFSPPHTALAYTLNHLASLAFDQFQYEKGIPFAQASYEQRVAIFGPIHVETIASQSNLCRLYSGAGRYEEALALRYDLKKNISQVFGDYLHPYVLAQDQGIAGLYGNLNRWEEAAAAGRQLLENMEKLTTPYPTAYVPYQGYGRALYHLGRSTEAESFLRKALDLLSVSNRVLPGSVITVRYDLALCLDKNGKKAEARRLMEEARDLLPEYEDIPAQRISRMAEILAGKSL